MPSGIVHFQAGLVLGAVVNTSSFYLGASGTQLLALGCGTAIGLLLTPDMDLTKTTYPEHQLKRIPIFGWCVYLLTLPYGALFTHRGISHHLVFGTLTRMAYMAAALLFCVAGIYGLLCLLGQPPTVFWHSREPQIGMANVVLLGFGWWLQDALHICMDRFSSWWKR